MNKDIFEFKDYKAYLKALIAGKPGGGRGVRAAMAKSIGSTVSHISQVLSGDSHFTFEQAEGVNEFLAHSKDEAIFFLMLVQLARAGTPALRKRVGEQMGELLSKRLVLKERLGVKESLDERDQMTFCSSWIYGAVHVATSIPKLQTKEALSAQLGVSKKKIGEVLEFLMSVGLVVSAEGGKFKMGVARFHLSDDSPMIAKFHTNWRMQAIGSLDAEKTKEDLHYSSAVSLSDADVLHIKSTLVKTITEIKAVIKESKEEGVHCLSLDFFRLG